MSHSAAVLRFLPKEEPPNKERSERDRLWKRCTCRERQWNKCTHPWYFRFFKKVCACKGRGDQCEHRRQNRRQVSLHKLANKPAGYWMSKTEAKELCEKLRVQAREGRVAESKAVTTQQLTFGELADRFFNEVVQQPHRRESPMAAIKNYLRIAREVEIPSANGSTIRFEAKRIAEITDENLEAVRNARRAQLRQAAERRHEARGKAERTGKIVLPGVKGGEVGIEHLMAVLRQLFKWAAAKALVASNPFKRNGEIVVKVSTRTKAKKEHRHRRLRAEPQEEERLLKHSRPKGRREGMENHLHDLIIAALETACREGELLSLQVHQLKSKNGVVLHHIDLPADKTKTNDPRKVPISARLRTVLEGRLRGPDGKPLGSNAYVFGDEAGGQVGRVYLAWRATCRRAGIEDLHFHDLRHEAISRLLDKGVPVHHAMKWAGHRNLETTSIYANAELEHLEQALELVEGCATRAPLQQAEGSTSVRL
jgi:integrase